MTAAPKVQTLKKMRGPLAIAVSGGGDSMALLRLALAQGHALVALTVDHALRKNSAAEAQQVKAWCRALGVKHVTLTWRHGPVNSGIQAKARAARYDLMAAWCAKHGVGTLLTAHTKDDQAETVVMRQRRTSAVKSLTAIWPETAWNGIRILRPLLSLTRKRLRTYLTAIGQDWLEDPSNTNEAFERVRLRASGVDPRHARLAARAQRQTQQAQREAGAWFAKQVAINSAGMMSFASASFQRLSALAQDEALGQLIIAAGGKVPDHAGRARLLRWLAQGTGNRHTLGGVIFAKRKLEVLAAREPERIDQNPLLLNARKPVLWDNRFLISGPKGAQVVPKSQVKCLKRNPSLPAFVDQGLPVILKDGKVLADSFVSGGTKARITLSLK